MPSLERLKSIMRYCLRVPPPLWRTVMCPLLLRPECFLRTSMSERSGSTFERSEKSIVVTKRRPGLVGRYFLTGILLLEVVDAAQFDFLTGLQSDDRLLKVALLTAAAVAATRDVALLAANVDRIDAHHVHAEDRLDRVTNLRLGRLRMHDEGILRAERMGHRFFGNARREAHIACVHASCLQSRRTRPS